MKQKPYPAIMFVAIALPVFVLLTQASAGSSYANAAAICLSINGCSTSSNAQSVKTLSVSQNNGARPIFSLAQTQRVAWVNIGDSNMIFGGYGWDHGISKALQQNFGVWGTGVQPINGEGRWGDAGYLSKQLFGTINSSGAPAILTDRLTATPATIPYAYLPSGTANQIGMIYFGDNVNHQLRYHFTYATDPSWNGTFRPAIRLGQPPYTDLVASQTTMSDAGPAGQYVDSFLDLPAGRAQSGQVLNMRLHTNSDQMNAQFFGTMQSVEDVSVTKGFSEQVLSFYPSHSTRDTLIELRNFGIASLGEYFRQVRRQLGPRQAVVVAINEGLNDRNDHGQSVGPAGNLDSSTPEGFKDNTRGIINLIRSVYQTNNWNQNDLYFVLYPSHPVSTPDDITLVGYRRAATEIAREGQNTSAIAIDKLITSDEMLSRGYYQSNGADRYHLTQAAYENIGARIVASMSPLVALPPENQ